MWLCDRHCDKLPKLLFSEMLIASVGDALSSLQLQLGPSGLPQLHKVTLPSPPVANIQ